MLPDWGEEPPPPCVQRHCETEFYVGSPAGRTIVGTKVSIKNACPRHYGHYETTVTGGMIYRMIENGNPMGVFLRDRLMKMRSDEIEAAEADMAPTDHKMIALSYLNASPVRVLLMELSDAERAATTPGQRGLTPP